MLDVVAEVRPHDARAHDGEIAPEGHGDLLRGGRRRGGGHAEHRGLAERLQRAADEEVVGPEVVPPHADAVHLVDHDEADADGTQRRDERLAPQPLGRCVEDPRAALTHVADPARGDVGVEGRVDEGGRGGDPGGQLVDLVLHQRDQRREDEGGLGSQHRCKLVGQRLSRPGRHQRERVAARDRSAHDLLLAGAEVGEAVVLLKGGS